MDSQVITDKDYQDVLTIRASALAMFLLSLAMFFVAVNLVLVADGYSSGWNIDFQTADFDLWLFLGSLVLLVFVHEALHALAALLWGKASFSSIRFGHNLKWLVAYCHCSSPMRMGAFRRLLLLPLAVTVPVAGLFLLLYPSLSTLLLFCLSFSACAGDVLIEFKVQNFPADLWVQDHPSEVGCYVWPEGHSPQE
ncbi:MAG: DUF3267 domain-containing protein [Gemmatimonadota bacterium]|nr:DUF3267 domain-containing protein [Gemmatimonadota bacterium]